MRRCLKLVDIIIKMVADSPINVTCVYLNCSILSRVSYDVCATSLTHHMCLAVQPVQVFDVHFCDSTTFTLLVQL